MLATPYDVYFQEAGSPISEAIIELHDFIMAILLYVLGVVITTLSFALISDNTIIFWRNNFGWSKNRNREIPLKDINHGTYLEIVWTLIPIILLVLIALPSFSLLYLIEELLYPNLTIKFIGNQWYWDVNINDFLGRVPIDVDFSTYLVPTEALYPGDLRVLTADENIVVPTNAIIRYLTTSNDVIHSLAVPSLGIKMDSIPGRLNSGILEIVKPGLYYGNCSELCGSQHFAMPICLEATSIENYVVWLMCVSDTLPVLAH